ncbi:MAG: YgjP-like metallopeptidase domain-containing protein, partial [Candidatus Limnocylindrales bacterium]
MRRSARARHLRLTIDPRHTAVVTIPVRAASTKGDAERLAESFVAEREQWLRRHLERQARQTEQLAEFGPLGDGGLFRFRGEPHRLRIVIGATGRQRTTISREGADEGDERVVLVGKGERRALASILAAWLR